jgi:hypothetical protein
MIMSTFAESLDFTGKTIHPFTTHAMSGLGTTERGYAASCPGATIGRGLAVQGEKVKDAGLAYSRCAFARVTAAAVSPCSTVAAGNNDTIRTPRA